MDNNFYTGKPHIDLILFCIAWVGILFGKIFVFIGWGNAPVFVTCLASSLLAVKTGWELYDKWKAKKQNKKRQR